MLSTSLLDQSQQRTLSEWPEWICFKPWCQTCLLGLSDVFRRFVAWWKNARKPSRSSYIVNSFYLWARKEASCDFSGPTSWPGGRESWAESQIKRTRRWRKRYLDTKRLGRPLAHWTAEHHPVWEVNTLWTFQNNFNSRKRREMGSYQIAFCSPWVVESDTSVRPGCKQTSVVFTVAQREESFVAHDLALQASHLGVPNLWW